MLELSYGMATCALVSTLRRGVQAGRDALCGRDAGWDASRWRRTSSASTMCINILAAVSVGLALETAGGGDSARRGSLAGCAGPLGAD